MIMFSHKFKSQDIFLCRKKKHVHNNLLLLKKNYEKINFLMFQIIQCNEIKTE